MSPAELVKLRADLDLHQRDLASLLGVERHTVQRWERDDAPVPHPSRVKPWLAALEDYAALSVRDRRDLGWLLARKGTLAVWREVLVSVQL